MEIMDSVIETQNKLNKILSSDSADWVKRRGIKRLGFSIGETELIFNKS